MYINPITKAISDVKFRIPKAILEEAFLRRRGFSQFAKTTPVSLDYRIREEVIDARVIPDCNLVGGTEVTIPLHSVVPIHAPEHKTVYRIPLSLTQNRKITRVYALVYGTGGVPTHSNFFSSGGSIYDDAAAGLLASHAPIPHVQNIEVRLIGENTIMTDNMVPISPNLHLRCVLEADNEFSHLKPTSIPIFSKLVEYAVKSYVYNTLIIEVDSAYLTGGQELGRFLSIIEDYSDSETLYEELFNDKWKKVAIFSDDQARKRHLKMVVSGRH